ncbi:MAG: BREX-6 system BrxE protein [Nannocystaceae bacterium]
MHLSQGQLDQILTVQLAVAWAGESGEDQPRLRWWSTDMVSEFGGQDLFERLLPNTWEWATLEVVREAARRTDAKARKRDSQPDRLVSLYRLGFEVDEQLRDRRRELKQAGAAPQAALPGLGAAMAHWDPVTFQKWLSQGEKPKTVKEPSGRRLTNHPPPDPVETVRRLAHALLPISDNYPCPHYRDASAVE